MTTHCAAGSVSAPEGQTTLCRERVCREVNLSFTPTLFQSKAFAIISPVPLMQPDSDSPVCVCALRPLDIHKSIYRPHIELAFKSWGKGERGTVLNFRRRKLCPRHSYLIWKPFVGDEIEHATSAKISVSVRPDSRKKAVEMSEVTTTTPSGKTTDPYMLGSINTR